MLKYMWNNENTSKREVEKDKILLCSNDVLDLGQILSESERQDFVQRC